MQNDPSSSSTSKKKSSCKCKPVCKHQSCKNKPPQKSEDKPPKHVAISPEPPVSHYPPKHDCSKPREPRPPTPKPPVFTPPIFTTDSLINVVSDEICSCKLVANAVRSPEIHQYIGLRNLRTQPFGEIVIPPIEEAAEVTVEEEEIEVVEHTVKIIPKPA